MRALRFLALVLALAIAACTSPGTGSGATPPAAESPSSASPTTGSPGTGGGQPSVVPLIVSTQQTVGENRFVFSFIDAATNTPAATPDRTAAVGFTPPGSSTASDPVEATFVWAIENERGVYVAHASFATPGEWTATFVTKPANGPEERIAMRFDVVEDASAIAVGEAAPASDTPVASDVGGDVAKLSTDPEPNPRFYTTSVADAVTANEPFVLVFATPAFCQTAQCGPTLDRVKSVAAAYPDVTFIHVEPYQLTFSEGRLQPVLDAQGQLQPVPSVLDWGILSEPWVYVVGSDGKVAASFEGIFAEQELRDALDAVAS